MKLIIEIPDEVYEKQLYLHYFGAWRFILNGIPLPKELERLIDANETENTEDE